MGQDAGGIGGDGRFIEAGGSVGGDFEAVIVGVGDIVGEAGGIRVNDGGVGERIDVGGQDDAVGEDGPDFADGKSAVGVAGDDGGVGGVEQVAQHRVGGGDVGQRRR